MRPRVAEALASPGGLSGTAVLSVLQDAIAQVPCQIAKVIVGYRRP